MHVSNHHFKSSHTQIASGSEVPLGMSPPPHTRTFIPLTHWGRVTHICVGKLTIIGSDNSLSPGRRQAIIWTNAGILLFGPLGTNFSEILIEIQAFSLKKIRLKMSSAKCGSFCLGLNVLTVIATLFLPLHRPIPRHPVEYVVGWLIHHCGVIMSARASQITGVSIIYTTVCSDANQRKHQSSAALALCGEFTGHRWIPRSKGQWRGKCFHLMTSSYLGVVCCGKILTHIILLVFSYYVIDSSPPSVAYMRQWIGSALVQ